MAEMKKKLRIKIYSAAHTFLYLPMYIDQELEILKTILGDRQKVGIVEYEIDENAIEFVEPSTNKIKGDKGAISEMLQNTNINDKDDEHTLAIAIASPVAFLDKNSSNEDIGARVVGAMINKSTFWALATNDFSNEINELDDFKRFNNIIYPNNEYVTAHNLGKKVEQDANIANSKCVEFGEEIEELSSHSNAVAITADIASLAVAKKVDTPYHINYYFSKKEGEFLTTGIITSKRACEHFPGIIEKIIDSIQMSIAVLYMSKKTAEENCTRVVKNSKKSDFFDQNVKEGKREEAITEIVKMMYDEEFYPKSDLRVTRESWGKAVEAFLLGTDTEKANEFFEKYVNNDFVLKSTIKKLNIDLDAPRNTTPCKKYAKGGCPKIALLENQLKELQKEKCYCGRTMTFLKENKFILIVSFVLIAVAIANQIWDFIPIFNQESLFLISILPLVISLGIKRWVKKKRSENDK